MPVQGKKSLPIDIETHRLIDMESSATGIPMYVLVNKMWVAYLATKGDTTAISTREGTGTPIKANDSKELEPKLSKVRQIPYDDPDREVESEDSGPWELLATKEVLGSGYELAKGALQINLGALVDLVRRARNDERTKPGKDAGTQFIPGSEVETVLGRVTGFAAAVQAERRDMPRHKSSRKGVGKPKKRAS